MEAVWRLKQAQCCHLVVHCSSYLRIMSNVTLKAHPIVMMASLFWQLLVQMDILSPLGLTLTTAPQTSSLASSNDSPTKHNSCKKHKKSQTIHIFFFFFIFKSQPSGATSNGYDSTEWFQKTAVLPFPSSSDRGHCASVVCWESSAIDPPACSCRPPTWAWSHPDAQYEAAIKPYPCL